MNRLLIPLVCLTASLSLAAVGAPPNILVILTDDQGWGDLSLKTRQLLAGGRDLEEDGPGGVG